LAGAKDQGDIIACELPRVLCEVKSRTRPVSSQQIETWCRETDDEAVNANADLAVLIVHQSGRNVADWDTWMPIGDWSFLWHTVAYPSAVGEPWLMAPLRVWAPLVSAWVDAVHQVGES